MIDLRSDTVTKPTPAMRRAMMEAEVGDDVYGEDPTVNRLEQRAAEITGKEAALFVPTGTMGNAIAIKLHTEHGQEVISEARSHILDWELGMVAWFSGCVVRAIPTDNGILSWQQIRGYMKAFSQFWAPTGLVAIENTHNMLGGNVYSLEAIREIAEGAHERGVKVHMDGARVFNASAASGVPVSDIVAPVDTVMFCLSKGLGRPRDRYSPVLPSSSRRGVSIANASAAVCAKWACLPPLASSRWRNLLSCFLATMPMPAFLPKGSRAFPAFKLHLRAWLPTSRSSTLAPPELRPPRSARG